MLETNIFPRLRDGHLHSYQTLSDATQLFWRLRFAGHDTDDLAQQLHESWLSLASYEAENSDAFRPSLPPLAKICQHVSASVILSCVRTPSGLSANYLKCRLLVNLERVVADGGRIPRSELGNRHGAKRERSAAAGDHGLGADSV